MRAIVQRTKRASVQVDGEIVGEIGQGLLVFLCAEPGDTQALMERMLQKLLKLRIFEDDAGKMNRSVQDIAGGLLLVSQFTLAADVSRGNRPSFTQAAPPEQAKPQFEWFVQRASQLHPHVQSGVFAANMQIELINDGPVTIPIHMSAD